MRPPESFIGQPIRSLQTMLRVLAQNDARQPNVIPDGIYSTQTMQAVSAFQRNHGLPVTGVADQATWDSIHSSYENAIIFVSPAQPLELIFIPKGVYKRGDTDPDIYIIQAALLVLSELYESISPPSQNGIIDDATSLSIETFQEMIGLPRTGELDKQTWKHLALHYPLAVNLTRTKSEPDASFKN